MYLKATFPTACTRCWHSLFFFLVGDETGLPGRNCSKVSEDIWGNNWVVKASILNVGRLCRRCMSIFHLEITKRQFPYILI